jgi:acyl carrier protein
MNKDVVKNQLKEIMEQETKKSFETFDLSTTIEALGIESMHFIRIIIQVEKTFGVELSEEESSNIVTIDDFVNTIIEKGGEL